MQKQNFSLQKQNFLSKNLDQSDSSDFLIFDYSTWDKEDKMTTAKEMMMTWWQWDDKDDHDGTMKMMTMRWWDNDNDHNEMMKATMMRCRDDDGGNEMRWTRLWWHPKRWWCHDDNEMMKTTMTRWWWWDDEDIHDETVMRRWDNDDEKTKMTMMRWRRKTMRWPC